MNPESLKIQALEKFPVVMTKEKVAQALGIATHNIPPLVRSGLLKPLGQPRRYCVKHFSRDALAEKIASQEWLDSAGIELSLPNQSNAWLFEIWRVVLLRVEHGSIPHEQRVR